ncbi:UPF0688 protein C1orf174 homolog [Myripristis murdjan]|uniref:Si:ch211-147a11.3 n=1 Tax=Myripristis murdjan TaxID=586833 RepID=A0A668AZ21_9TELE|nr:UPF0688 protein C1orf174 homolog [Myripristis murdjan]
MRHKMPGQLRNLKRRKGKSGSETKSSSKASATKRKDIKRPKTDPAAGFQKRNSAVCGYSTPASPLERFSHITCECHQVPDRKRCLASPQLEEQEGKENEVRMRLELDGCRAYGFLDTEEAEYMDYASSGKSIFPDDDSNQILPVEQFFGNLDTVQDFPQRSATSSIWVHRESRRRHFYAKEDSDEEEAGYTDMQQDDRGGS